MRNVEPLQREICAYIDGNTKCNGVLRYTGTIRIDGEVDGEIDTEGVLLIGRTAVVRATVRAKSVICCGTIFGNVTATEKVTLLEPAVLRGSVATPVLTMETGVQFSGILEVAEGGQGEPALQGVPDREVAEVANS